jgi:uncharacterized surface protein with fasciclin (FAS1) repeats
MANIIDTAINAGNFTTLIAAIKAANLTNILQDPGPFTVFAPTDEAFAKLPEGAVEALLQDIPRLKQVLKYHVVSAKLMTDEITRLKMKSATTVEGSNIRIDLSNGVKINNAMVTSPDIEADNGVIHIINTVLMPKIKAIVEPAQG